eukprot:2888043-Pyramimonas_sp.AAC.1
MGTLPWTCPDLLGVRGAAPRARNRSMVYQLPVWILVRTQSTTTNNTTSGDTMAVLLVLKHLVALRLLLALI